MSFNRLCTFVFGSLLLGFLFFSGVTLGQTPSVEVTRNVNLRKAPSKTSIALKLLVPEERLDLVNARRKGGYYHVRLVSGEKGWVWAGNVKAVVIVEKSMDLTTATTAISAGSIAQHVDKNWTKGTPKKTAFFGTEGVCPFDGNGSDPEQFTLKNRSDIPASYHDVTWSAIDELDFPGRTNKKYAPIHRKDWNQDQLAAIQPYESIPVRVVDYLVAIKPQNGGSGEGTNCNFNKAGDVDAHLALVGTFGEPESRSIVIEWTPRFLTLHPNWTRGKLLPWLDRDMPVRISGWLMIDPDHINHLGRFRNTLWEIHPITRIEVLKDGVFVDLDSIP